MSIAPLGEARDHLSEYVSDVERTHERVTITRHGQPAAVLISPAELEALEITIEALSDPGTLGRITEAEDAIENGDITDAGTIRSIVAARRRRRA